MSGKIFGDYDRAGLDGEYDNRAKVADAMRYLESYAADSAAVRAELGGELNVAFGAEPAETLDIFPAAAGSDGPAPVQVFYHGGYWRALSKDEFSFVARAMAPRGALTVVVNYALMPQVSMAELVRQCRAALAWTWRHAAEFGGDPANICVSGHSAGGHIVAMLVATDWPAFDPGLPAEPLRGACGISGLYDLEPIRLCFLNDELQLTPEDAARHSPVRLAPGCRPPLLLPVGGLEGPEFLRQSADLMRAWGQAGLDVAAHAMAGAHHFSIIEGLNDPDSALSRMLLRQMGL